MKTESVTSGNIGENVYATRPTHQRWDAYWWFPVPENLVGMGFIAKLNENSPVEATLALFPPGTDTETTPITDGRVQSQHFYPNSTPMKAGFHFNQSGKHIFAFSGSPNQAPDVFNRVMKEINAGKRPGAFLNLEIFELTYSDSLAQNSSQVSRQIINSIEQERLRPGAPSISKQSFQNQTPASQQQKNSPDPNQPSYTNSQAQQPVNHHTHVYINDVNGDSGSTKKKRGCWFWPLVLGGIVILLCGGYVIINLFICSLDNWMYC